MKIHLLTGFLGSGKTTAIHQAVKLLKAQGKKPGVITNDQGAQLVDGSFFKQLDVPGREVINGCFCCNYADLDERIASLAEENIGIIFAESVGSCTDIMATVFKPLLQFRPELHTTVSTFTDVRLLQMILEGRSGFDETVRYIYLKQLEEATIIIINKTDIITSEQLQKVEELVEEKYPGKTLLSQNSLDQENIEQWLYTLDNASATAPGSLRIDNDIYAQGEANMGWLDQQVTIYSAGNNALEQAEELINTIYTKVQEQKYPIGHLKFLVNDRIKLSFTTADERFAVIAHQPAANARLLINMRVQTSPDQLQKVMNEAIAEIEHHDACGIVVDSQAAFQPGYPKPAYRF